jgi:hypothetical protein
MLDHNLEEMENGGIKGFSAMPMAHQSLQDGLRIFFTGRIELCLEVSEQIVNGIRHAHAGGGILKPANSLRLSRRVSEAASWAPKSVSLTRLARASGRVKDRLCTTLA